MNQPANDPNEQAVAEVVQKLLTVFPLLSEIEPALVYRLASPESAEADAEPDAKSDKERP